MERCFACLVCALSLLPAVPAVADGAPAEGVLDTVFVIATARKRTELLKDIPLAVSVYTGDFLADRRITNTADLPMIAPSLTFSQSANARGEGFQIRGVGTSIFSDTIEQSVGFVVDGVPLARSGQAVGEMLDVSTVEVLRGPQGMLFGKNASAGLVMVATNKPELGVKTFEGHLSVASGDEIKDRFVGNIPLGDNSALRLAYGATRADGYVRNITRNENLNNRDEQNYRVRWLLMPSQDIDINITADGGTKHTLCCAWTARAAPAATAFGLLNAQAGIVPGPENLQVAAGGTFFQNSDTHGISAELNYSMGWAALTSITAYRDWKNTDNNDADLLPINALDRNRGSSDLVQRSQELRLASPSGRDIEWLAGLYWSDQENRANNEQAGTLGQALPAGAILGTGFTSMTKNRSSAVFGQGSIKLNERFKVIAAGRYTDEYLGLELNQFKTALPVLHGGRFALHRPAPLRTCPRHQRCGAAGRRSAENATCLTGADALPSFLFAGVFGVKFLVHQQPWRDKTMTTATARKAAEPAAVRISKDIDRALSSAAKDFKTTRASIVKNALLEYLEDLSDSKAIAEAKKKGGKMITHAELKAQLGL